MKATRSAALAALVSARAAGVRLDLTPVGKIRMRGVPHIPAGVAAAIAQHRDGIARLLAPDSSFRPRRAVPDLEVMLDLAESLADDVPDWNREQARADALNNPLPPQASEIKGKHR